MKGKDIVRKHGISEQTFYRWKSKYGGMDVSDARKLKSLEAENARLKKLLADQMLDNAALKELFSKEWYSPRSGASRLGILLAARCCLSAEPVG